MKEVWRNLDGPSKNKQFVELRSDFEFSRLKVAQIGTARRCPISYSYTHTLRGVSWNIELHVVTAMFC